MEANRARGRGRAQAFEMWRRQLEADAASHVQGQAPLPTEQNPTAEPVAGPTPIEARAKSEVDAITRHRETDAFEAGQVQRGQENRRAESEQLDGRQDGELRAGQHLRLKEQRAPAQPPQNLLTTLAAQRKQGARNRRRVAQTGQKRTSSNGFGHLPHQGLWKAQGIDGAPAAPQRERPRGPAPRAQVAFS